MQTKTKVLLLCCFMIIGSTSQLHADSPLTSTQFYKAYSSVPVIISASKTNGKLTAELMEYLANPDNPIDVKMALVNRLGWDINGSSNSGIFFGSISSTKLYRDMDEFKIHGTAGELITYAYLKAMDNYFDTKEALEFASLAQGKEPGGYTINLIKGLITAQYVFDNNWCEAFKSTDDVRINKKLIMDMKPEAIKEVFDYMDIYREYCK
jgi:hypothetical protein